MLHWLQSMLPFQNKLHCILHSIHNLQNRPTQRTQLSKSIRKSNKKKRLSMKRLTKSAGYCVWFSLCRNTPVLVKIENHGYPACWTRTKLLQIYYAHWREREREIDLLSSFDVNQRIVTNHVKGFERRGSRITFSSSGISMTASLKKMA